MTGIINLNKSEGISSNKILYEIKNKFHEKKVGHLGTLDPMATGVLPVCLGKATKLFDYFLNKTKCYVASFTFGKETDTLDKEGKVTKETNIIPLLKELEIITKSFIKKYSQMPPKYSAKKVNGRKAYELSRSGVEFELKPKIVEIYDIYITKQISGDTFEFFIKCSSGTYIRSIVRDIASECGTVGYMSKLCRTKSGEFTIEQSVDVENMTEKNIIPLDKVLESMEKIFIEDALFDKLKNGVKIKVESEDKLQVLVYCLNKIFGLGKIENNMLKITTNLFKE